MPEDNKTYERLARRRFSMEVTITTGADRNLESYSWVRRLSIFTPHVIFNSPFSKFRDGPWILKTK